MKMQTNPYTFSVDTAGFSFWGKISDRCSGGFQEKTKLLLIENQWTQEDTGCSFFLISKAIQIQNGYDGYYSKFQLSPSFPHLKLTAEWKAPMSQLCIQ